MKRNYTDRNFIPEVKDTELVLFFFPKHNPPVSISARTQEEAEAKLAAIDNSKEHE